MHDVSKIVRLGVGLCFQRQRPSHAGISPTSQLAACAPQEAPARSTAGRLYRQGSRHGFHAAIGSKLWGVFVVVCSWVEGLKF